jgi:hypothetical protein
VRRFKTGFRNCAIRYVPFAAISTPSKPARRAHEEAAPYSSTVRAMSPAFISRGVTVSFGPAGVREISPGLIADGPRGSAPPRWSGCELAPACHSCSTLRPPSAWTTSVTRLHAATCREL